jgi:hypothetical protein
VEREFGRLKNEWGMLPLQVRRIYRVRLHVDLTILAQLASAGGRGRRLGLLPAAWHVSCFDLRVSV